MNGNVLDLLISREDYYYVCYVTLTGMISDDTMLDIKSAINKRGLPEIGVTYRKYGTFDIT